MADRRKKGLALWNDRVVPYSTGQAKRVGPCDITLGGKVLLGALTELLGCLGILGYWSLIEPQFDK